MKRISFSISILMILLFVSCDKQNQPELYTQKGAALGTTYHVKYFSSEEINAEKAFDSIFEVINSSMSTYQQDSDISRINKGAEDLKVDKHFRTVFKASKRIFKESNGYFDPTAGTLVNAYGFGPNKPLKELQEEELDSLREIVGLQKLELTKDQTIKKEKPNIFLDFNAIAKGYTLDVMADYLDSKNIENYLIELGGELVAKGKSLERDSKWYVAIDNPQQTQEERTFQTVLGLKDGAMATSGNYRKYRRDSVSGKRFVHTVNPLTGQAERSDLLSTSVLAENCMLADAYATAFMALGYEKSLEMLERLENVDVYFIYLDEHESIRIYTSKGFEEALDDD